MIGFAKGSDAHYCKTSQSDQVYVISDMLLMDLPKTADDLKETGTGTSSPGSPSLPGSPSVPGMPPPSTS